MPLLVRPLVLGPKRPAPVCSIQHLAPRMRTLPLRPHGVQGTVMHFMEAMQSLTVCVLFYKYYTVIFGVSRGA